MAASLKYPLELRAARLTALRRVVMDEATAYPADVGLPGGLVGITRYPDQVVHCETRGDAEALLTAARLALVDDGIAIHWRPDGSAQLLDKDFAQPGTARAG